MSVGISSRKCWPQIIFFLVQMDVHVQHQGNLDHVFTTLNVPYYRTINGVWWLSGCPSQTSMQKRWHDSTTANEMKSFSVRSTPHDMTVAMGNNNSSCRMKPSYIRFFSLFTVPPSMFHLHIPNLRKRRSGLLWQHSEIQGHAVEFTPVDTHTHAPSSNYASVGLLSHRWMRKYASGNTWGCKDYLLE